MSPLGLDDKERLLSLARRALERYLETGAILEPPSGLAATTDAGGVFVTLRRQGTLRGCIGVIGLEDTLAPSVVRCCLAAATEDPRFPKVPFAELPHLTVEISVLSPLVPVSSADEIVVGRDGLQLEKGGRRGVLLPQVPVEQGWDRQEFLAAVCRKAGLPAGAWESGASMQRFSAEVFQEAGAARS